MALSENIKTISTLTLLKIVGTVLGLVYSIYQVRYFGTSREIEVFFAAQSVVYLITSLTQSGQLAEIFLPEYIKLKNTIHPTAAHKAYSVVINRITIYIIVILALGYMLAPLLMNAFIPGFSENDRSLAVNIFRVFLPFILMTIQNAFVNTILNAEKIYGRSEIGGVINYIVSLVFLILFFESLGIWVLVLSLYAGMIIQSLMSIWYARRANLKYHLIFSYDQFHHARFFRSMFSTFSYVGATQCLNWATTASVSFLPQGVYAIFQYVEKLSTKINGVFVPPISAVFFTKISEKVVKSNGTALLKTFIKKAQEYALFVGIIVSVVSIAGGKEVLTFLWYGEKMGDKELELAYWFFCSFSVVTVFQVFYAVNRKVTVALGKATMIYNLQSIIQLVSAALMYGLVVAFQTNGLIMAIALKWILLIFVPYFINFFFISSSFSPPGKKNVLTFLFSYLLCIVAVMWLKEVVPNALHPGYSKSWNIVYSMVWGVFAMAIFIIFSFLSNKSYYSDILLLFNRNKKSTI